MNMLTTAPRRVASALLLIGSLVVVSDVSAQVNLTFSGGGGTPLSISWTTPITYTITAVPFNNGKDPWFVFDEVGDPYGNVQHSAPDFHTAGAPTYTGVDGTYGINNIFSGNAFNDVTVHDIVFQHVPAVGTTLLYTGETFTLSAGTLTTSVPYNGVLPANGLYSTFITDASEHFMGSGSLSAVPEPSTYAAIVGLASIGCAAWRRRKTSLTSVPAGNPGA